MFAALMVFSALSPALADSSMLDAELSGRIGAKVNSYRDMADAPKSDVIVFSVLIIVLLVKPTGILGKKIREKV